MEIRNLSAFLQVATTKNFTQSALILGYSQSNISMQIQQLETELGVPLFDRIGRHITLTHYGQELLPYAHQIVSTALKMQNLKRTDESLCGTLKVGMTYSIFEILFKNTIEKYHSRFPNVNVELRLDDATLLLEALKNGQLDIACLIYNQAEKSNWNCLYSQPCQISLISNKYKGLGLKENISVSDIAKEEFILMEDRASYNILFHNWLSYNNIEPKVFLKLQSTEMARKLVETGNYLSVLPFYTVSQHINNGNIKILELPDFNLTQYVQVITYKSKVLTPQISGFSEEIKPFLDFFLLR